MNDDINELSASLDSVANVLELAQKDPLAAAKVLEAWAEELMKVAKQLRLSPPEDMICQGGTMDKVSVVTVGPDGRPRSIGGN